MNKYGIASLRIVALAEGRRVRERRRQFWRTVTFVVRRCGEASSTGIEFRRQRKSIRYSYSSLSIGKGYIHGEKTDNSLVGGLP